MTSKPPVTPASADNRITSDATSDDDGEAVVETVVENALAAEPAEPGHAYRARLLFFSGDPHRDGDSAVHYFEDGLLWVVQGRVQGVGAASEWLTRLPMATPVEHFEHHLISAGFIDTHIHFPQTEMIAAFGSQLLDWLNRYTFPVEQKFADPIYSAEIAAFFLDELLRNGTTTALVFGTVHPASVEALFADAQRRGLRLIAGKVLMDRNAPETLCEPPEIAIDHSVSLIERWHGIDRLQYALTPRFAPTSSPGLLAATGELRQRYPDTYVHTHLAENKAEVEWVQSLFPDSAHYLDVYDQAGLVGPRSVFAHGIHLCDSACSRLGQTGAAIAHCPTSNLFLGSGLLALDRLYHHNVTVGLGTDVGAGTSFSLLRTLDEAYKVQQLRGHSLEPLHALYLATLGGARALNLDTCVGSLQVGFEADFIVLDLHATDLLQFRTAHCESLQELVFVLNTLGDDRVVARTYSQGVCVHQRDVTGGKTV